MSRSFKRSVKTVAGASFKSLLDTLNIYKKLKLILTYHRVVKESDGSLCDPAILVTPKTFEMQIVEISKRFKILPLEDFVTHSGDGRVCSITFDDGWRDNYEFAFPLLKKHGAPATIFLTTGLIGSEKTFWFQRVWDQAVSATRNGLKKEFIGYYGSLAPSWRPADMGDEGISALFSNLKSLPAEKLESISMEAYGAIGLDRSPERDVLSWEEVREMSGAGVSFGSHGVNHHILPRLESEMKRREIFESLKMLRDKGVSVSPFFAYPNGDWDEESIAFVKEAGYIGAVTTQLGHHQPDTDPFLLRRIHMHEYMSNSPPLLWFSVFQAMVASPSS